jgi:hypothetical protein
MKTLLTALMLMLAACGSSDNDEPEKEYGKGWIAEEVVNLNEMCLAVGDVYSDVTDRQAFCECWTEFWVVRVTPKEFDDNMQTLLQLHQQTAHDQCVARQI